MRISFRESIIFSEPFDAFFEALSRDIVREVQFKLLDTRYSEFMSKRLGITIYVARGLLLWLFHMKKGRTRSEYVQNLPCLFNVALMYAKMVSGQKLEKSELRYISGPSQELKTVSTNLLNNMKWMIEHFGLQFFARKYRYIIEFPDQSYFLELRGGMFESNFGVEVILGELRGENHPEGGIFARVGFDIVGNSIRIVRIGGVKGKGHIINEEFPKKMGINPFKLLILLVIQFAYQNEFTEISGIKERYHPHIRLRAGEMGYTPYYRNLGMRKHREVEHYRSIATEDDYRYFRRRVRAEEERTVSLFTSAWNEMGILENIFRINDDDYPLPDGTFLKIETRNRLVSI